MSRPVQKAAPIDVSPSTKTLTTAYSGWTSDTFFCKDMDTLRVHLAVGDGWDGTSLELKSQVYEASSATWFTELSNTAGTAAVDSVTIADATTFATESDACVIALDVRGYERVRVAAKRTGGSAGSLTMYMSGG